MRETARSFQRSCLFWENRFSFWLEGHNWSTKNGLKGLMSRLKKTLKQFPFFTFEGHNSAKPNPAPNIKTRIPTNTLPLRTNHLLPIHNSKLTFKTNMRLLHLALHHSPPFSLRLLHLKPGLGQFPTTLCFGGNRVHFL